MSKLKEIALEYVTGNKSRRFYEQHRNLKGSRFMEKLDSASVKYIPNLIAIVSAGNAVLDLDPAFFLGSLVITEGMVRGVSRLTLAGYKILNVDDDARMEHNEDRKN